MTSFFRSKHFSVYFLVLFPTSSGTDKNECELAQDDCHSNATCHNVVGSFMCTCNDGFEGNGTSCIGKKNLYPLPGPVSLYTHYILD